MSVFAHIEKPTLLVDQYKTQRNILRMSRKAQQLGVRFRPHFKTHQSAEIGAWFRQAGVTAITVSSVDMARYFAAANWKDITIAFPINWRQIDAIRQLASQVHLELLVESPETVQMLTERLPGGADLWIKVDVGAHRTGIAWDQPEAVIALARAIASAPGLRLRGLLTHAGQTYHAGSPAAVRASYQETVERLSGLRRALEVHGLSSLEVSVGDTPSASLCQDFGAVDEIRPGNFVFYDAMMLAAGVCQAEDVAVAVASPVKWWYMAAPYIFQKIIWKAMGIRYMGMLPCPRARVGVRRSLGLMFQPFRRSMASCACRRPISTASASVTWCASCRHIPASQCRSWASIARWMAGELPPSIASPPRT
jgi:D-serine deaminase-like pyridoxal phosphate-dependent protein